MVASDGSFTQPMIFSGASVATMASPVGTAQYTASTCVGMTTVRPAMSVISRSAPVPVAALLPGRAPGLPRPDRRRSLPQAAGPAGQQRHGHEFPPDARCFHGSLFLDVSEHWFFPPAVERLSHLPFLGRYPETRADARECALCGSAARHELHNGNAPLERAAVAGLLLHDAHVHAIRLAQRPLRHHFVGTAEPHQSRVMSPTLVAHRNAWSGKCVVMTMAMPSLARREICRKTFTWLP